MAACPRPVRALITALSILFTFLTVGPHVASAQTASPDQAAIAYTLASAYGEFAEKDKGSLEPNKLADLAVLSQDIFTVPVTDLPKTESILTLVGGKATYDAKVLRPQ